MNTWLISWWDSFRGSFWFVPSIMSICAVGFAFGMCEADRQIQHSGDEFQAIATTAPAARSTLSAVASATIALAGVVFSLSILTLSNASAQFGSRIIRSVMTGSIADLVIGQFVGTSLYCLLVLRTIRDPSEVSTPFVPSLAVSLGVVLGIVSLLMLIWFVHHVANVIQAPKLVQSIGKEFHDSIDRLFPERNEDPGKRESGDIIDSHELLANLGSHNFEVRSSEDGYIEGIDTVGLVSIADKNQLVVALDCRPGDFVSQGRRIMRVWERRKENASRDQGLDQEDLTERLTNMVVCGAIRTPRQDVGCAAFELVEVATRALSPGMNDPFTALNCLDRLGAGLERLADRKAQPRIHFADGQPRVIYTSVITFAELLRTSTEPIIQFGGQIPMIAVRLLEVIQQIGHCVSREQDIDAMRDVVRRLKSSLDRADGYCLENDQVEREFQNVERLLRTLQGGGHVGQTGNKVVAAQPL